MESITGVPKIGIDNLENIDNAVEEVKVVEKEKPERKLQQKLMPMY